MLIEELAAFETIMEKKIKQVIIPNKYEAKTVTAQEVLGAIRNDYKNLVSNSIVRKSEDIVTSSKKRQPVCSFCSNKSLALEDIIDLTLEIINNSTIQKD
jgi:chromosome partitioning protein